MGQCLNVEINDAFNNNICRVDVKSSMFSKRKGSKLLFLNSSKIEVFWDLSSAKFGSGMEPVEGYYIAIVCREEMALFIGDMKKKAFKKTGADMSLSSAVFIAKREHVYGKSVFGTIAQFCDNGQNHDLRIECDTSFRDNPCLVVRIDAKTVMQIKHLKWKFRGNDTILVDGLPVEVFWDVHDWFFGSSSGNAVFMFQTTEKLWTSQRVSDQSVFSWSCRESKLSALGFSLILYAWKSE